MIRVQVWAKSAIARAGLESIVQADGRFAIARSEMRGAPLPASGVDADVVLIDLAEGGTRPPAELAGFDRTAQVVLLENPTRGELLRLLQDGPRTLLLRDSAPGEITAALEAASEGLVALSPELLELLWPAGSEIAALDELPPGEPLTARESEVLALLADGAGNKEIAARLAISEHTVKFHVSSILNKLGAATRTEAVTRGYKEGLIVI
ncbi:response regulator transcription factor [Acidobacteria bacterium AB60]|nr:response regulator transcription factor [Acidobacteria bacterium AB60]